MKKSSPLFVSPDEFETFYASTVIRLQARCRERVSLLASGITHLEGLRTTAQAVGEVELQEEIASHVALAQRKLGALEAAAGRIPRQEERRPAYQPGARKQEPREQPPPQKPGGRKDRLTGGPGEKETRPSGTARPPTPSSPRADVPPAPAALSLPERAGGAPLEPAAAHPSHLEELRPAEELPAGPAPVPVIQLESAHGDLKATWTLSGDTVVGPVVHREPEGGDDDEQDPDEESAAGWLRSVFGSRRQRS